MKETPFLGYVLDVAARTGWRSWHVPMPVQPVGGGRFVPSPRGRGLPDLILLHENPPRLIFAELKGTRGKLTDEQAEFLRLAGAVVESIREVVEYMRDGRPLDCAYGPVGRIPIGVYSWRPGDEQQVETVLRSRVMA